MSIMLNIKKDGWKSKKIDSLALTRFIDLRKRCRPDQEVGIVNGMLMIVPKGRITVMFERLYKRRTV